MLVSWLAAARSTNQKSLPLLGRTNFAGYCSGGASSSNTVRSTWALSVPLAKKATVRAEFRTGKVMVSRFVFSLSTQFAITRRDFLLQPSSVGKERSGMPIRAHAEKYQIEDWNLSRLQLEEFPQSVCS